LVYSTTNIGDKILYEYVEFCHNNNSNYLIVKSPDYTAKLVINI